MSDDVTPMMAQYLEIKAGHPDALLFYRMGDFYEMFFDDAVAASQALDIALTRRGKHLGQDIQMCGVPAHSAEGYLLTLIRKGFRVAVCDQMEDPAEARKRGSKSVVRREVVRLVTPGTLTEDTLLDARSSNFLAAFAEVRDEAALAWTDISTGELHVTPCPAVRLAPDLARLAPRELLVAEARLAELSARIEGPALTPLSPASFDSASAETRLTRLFHTASLDAFGSFGRAELSALGALVDYIDITQKGRLPFLRPPQREIAGGTLQIDAATRRNLEITRSLTGSRENSLLSAVDRTVTAAGARLLERRLSGPSCDAAVIAERLDAVALLVEDAGLRADLREALGRLPDIDRALSRIALDRGGPRDLAAIRAGLEAAAAIAARLGAAPGVLSPADLAGQDDLAALLDAALVAEPPLLLRDGGCVAGGYDAELDQTRRLRDEGRGVIAGLQADYAARAGVGSLKIRHNNVLGYYIETPDSHAERMLSPPLSEHFIHRQTTASAVRFTTVELSGLETRILNAGAHADAIERRIFGELAQAVLDRAPALSIIARRLAAIDLAAAAADLAAREDWTRPEIAADRSFAIAGGRHPVVEAALKRQGQPFIANDCDLSAGAGAAIWCLTGPNMAGKSTFLRQNALIVLLAQAGFYVPADHARIGLVSQLFSRVGAADDLARGRSTFMVEMVETAAILNQADDRALVILDEIGRGTATYDGLSIAWATLEHLHDVNRCRALFATHYHELTALADRLPDLVNATVTVKEWDGDVIFLHEVRRGAADRSYGVQVARLAGLPAAVVDRARVVLEALEKGEREGGTRKAALIDDLPLFSAARAQPAAAPVAPKPSELEARLKAVHPDELTPKQALDLLYQLKITALTAFRSGERLPGAAPHPKFRRHSLSPRGRGVRGERPPPGPTRQAPGGSPPAVALRLTFRGGRNPDLRRAQQSVMQHEAVGHHLNHVAGLGARHRRLEHRLMQLRIEGFARLGRDQFDPVLLEHVQQFALGQLDALDQRRIGLALFRGDRGHRPLHRIEYRQQVPGQFRAAVVLGLAPVALAALAGVLGIGQRPHETVLQLVAFRPKHVQLSRCRRRFGRFHVVLILHVLRLSHFSTLSPIRQQPPDQLRGVIHNRNDASIVQTCRADHPDRTDDLPVSVHIGRDHQRGTRK